MASFRADIATAGGPYGGRGSIGDRAGTVFDRQLQPIGSGGGGSLSSAVLVIWLTVLVLVVVGATIMMLELNSSSSAVKSPEGQPPGRALSSPVPSGSGVKHPPGITDEPSPVDSDNPRGKRSIRSAVWRDRDHRHLRDTTDDASDSDGADGSVFGGSDLPDPAPLPETSSAGGVDDGGDDYDGDDNDDGFDSGASILKNLHRSNEARLEETILAYQCSPEPLLPLEEDPVQLGDGEASRRFSFISAGGNTGGGSVGSELLDFVLDEDDDGGGGGGSGNGGGGTGGDDNPDSLRSPAASPAAAVIAPADPVAA